MPLNNDELEGLRDEPEPFCCLLADDSLITAVNVRTEQWYQPPAPDTSPSNVRLVIDVLIRVNPCHLREYRTWRLVTMPSTDAAWIDAI
jgi:hypothetical protein